MTVKELKEKLDKYPDDLIVKIGFDTTEIDPLGTNKYKRIIVSEPEFKYTVKYDDRGCEAYRFLRIS